MNDKEHLWNVFDFEYYVSDEPYCGTHVDAPRVDVDSPRVDVDKARADVDPTRVQ